MNTLNHQQELAAAADFTKKDYKIVSNRNAGQKFIDAVSGTLQPAWHKIGCIIELITVY